MATKRLLVILGIFGIICGGCQGIELILRPSSIITGQTSNLTMTCQAPKNMALTVVTFLQLAKVTAQDQTTSLVELLPGVQQPLFVDTGFSLRAQAFGQMDVLKGLVYLAVIIPSPLTSDRGTYRCTMSYVDSNHHPATDTTDATLGAVDLATIGQDLWSLQKDVETFKNCSCQSSTNTNKEGVAFSSRVFGVQGEALIDGELVPFSVIEFETHTILNASNHVFTIPRTGIYTMTLTLLAGPSSNSRFRADIRVNDIKKATMLVDMTHSSTMALNLKLVQGQEVKVVAYDGLNFTIDHYSYFSGNLIS